MNGGNPFILLDDARQHGAADARLYTNPVEIICADLDSQIELAIDHISEATKRGLHAAGYITYEAGLALEARLAGLVSNNSGAPYLWFGLFEDYETIAPDALEGWLPDGKGAWMGRLNPTILRGDYDAAFARVQEYIQAGDIYQANLTFQAEAAFQGDPLALYAAIRGNAAAGYGGVVFDGQQWMLSFSPELFFSLKDRWITARPMKGTAARCADSLADESARNALSEDPKQRAENLMIVDLLRNDLSRIAASGSVAVPELFHVESYPTIHQMTSTVTAALADNYDAADVVKHIFPCGSITGAPKIRAMEIIDELELGPRGIYCGSVGRLDNSGDAAFNVAIRTFTIIKGKESLSIGLGSGIVADSKAGDEWRECLAKGEFANVSAGQKIDLVETMAFDPAQGIARLEQHLERMKQSADLLEYEFDRHGARNAIQAISFHQDAPAKLRLMLAKSGAIAIELSPMPAALTQPVKVKLCNMTADARDYRLRHKTSDRRVYQADTGPEEHPVFLDNEGFVTEGAIWNIFVERGGKLCTPPLSRGLLPGILRAEMIADGRAVEADLRAEDLANGFILGNSLRGLVSAKLV